MLWVAVCDDELWIRRELAAKVSGYLERNRIAGKVTEFSSGGALLHDGGCFDIVLLDIEMNGVNGMQTAARLRERGERCEIVFVTSHASYVYDAFDVDASNFLVKPVSEKKLGAALGKAVRRALESGDSPFLTVKRGGDILKIRFCDILYCEAADHKLALHTRGGVVDYYENIAVLEQALDGRFFRCHRSYIVNLEHAVAYEKDAVLFGNGERALVSRRKAGELSQRLLEAVRSEVI